METNKFNYITIQQYLEGKLDEKAMHELEKQALDDPFLADALEGYAHAEVPAGKQLSILQTQLQERIAQQQENKNVFNFSWQRLSVAAAACLLFVTATMLFWIRENQAEKRLASRPKQVDVNLTLLDSTKTQPLEQSSAAEENIASVEDNTSTPVAEKRVASRARIATKRVKQVNKNSSEAILAAVAEPQTSIAKDQTSASFTIKARDLEEMSATSIEQAMQGRMAGVSIDSGKGSNAAALTGSEQVQIRGVQSAPLSFGAKQSLNASVPLNGWEAYNLYLKNNIRRIGEEIKNGLVLVSFSVNPFGAPENLKVVKSLSETADMEAIRLVKEGSLWKRGQDSTVLLPVHFEK